MTYTNAERAVNRAAWVAALRSGEYKQTTGLLCHVSSEDGTRRYCCLGVACELAAKAGVIAPFDEKAGAYMVDAGDDLQIGENGALPRVVANWLGVTRRGNTKAQGHTLIYYNDDERLTFAQIADVIESPNMILNPSSYDESDRP